jgi:spore cortex biosynthesis protein YabQ
MSIVKQFNDFLFFVILGIIISCIFDIFRTLRKVRKKNSIYVIMAQDIIFFAIITILTIIYMINIIDDRIRVYMFLAMGLGVAISRKILSKFLIKIYSIIFYTLRGSVKFLCVPLELWICIFCKIMKKVIKKCCKLFSLMINLKCKLLTVFGNMNNFKRRGLNNGKKSRSERKKKYKKEKKVS